MKLFGAKGNLNQGKRRVVRLRIKQLPPGGDKVFSRLWDMLFGCTHRNYSFPISSKSVQNRAPAARETGTYVVCLNCGKELAYDWNTMKIVNPQEHTAVPHAEESFAVK